MQEHARDSYENLLFSICRFREVTGRYPQTIAVRQVDQRTVCHSALSDAWNPSDVFSEGMTRYLAGAVLECASCSGRRSRRWSGEAQVASFEFKRSRFATMHRAALRWPLDRFRFFGSPALSDSALQVRPPQQPLSPAALPVCCVQPMAAALDVLPVCLRVGQQDYIMLHIDVQEVGRAYHLQQQIVGAYL